MSFVSEFLRRGISFSWTTKWGGGRREAVCKICGKGRNDHKSMAHVFQEE